MDKNNLGAKKIFTGIVKSDKMNKTRVVAVERKIRHPKYGKVISKVKSFYVHDEKNSSHTGDKVKIISTRPLSRLKRWRLLEILKA